MKRKKPTATGNINPVAKFAHKTNKCVAFEDRTKYKRKDKHKKDSRRDDGYHVFAQVNL